MTRVAERFSEEDLTRFMQIMLRTHNDLGYKQEQRFHLELGMLKLVHAQRLLPLEQLLSGEASQPKLSGSSAPVSRSATATARAATPATRNSVGSREAERDSRAPASSPFARPSPFEADRSRKSEPKAEVAIEVIAETPAIQTGSIAFEDRAAAGGGTATAVAVQVEVAVETMQEEVSGDAARNAILAALEDAGQNMLAHNLEEAEWSVRGIEVAAKVAMSQVLIDIALGPEPKRIIQSALNNLSNRPLKFKMVSGGTATVH